MTTTSVGDPLLGHALDGRYRIVERLARGGMATVYKAIDTRLTRTVAVKVMHVGLGDDTEFARKFDREARAAARLSHPCVVSVFDQGQDGGRPYIVMEYIEGPTLRSVINAEAPLPPIRALELIEPVLAALACAHEAGLIHRDVKPENVLFSARGQLKVADFGLAKAITSQTSTATQGLLIGTVSYLPPELVMSGTADARSDVYSAGIVLFELLTGRKPHTGETPIQVAYAHVHRDVPAPSTHPTAEPIPDYLDALIARATAREPDQRPHDAKVLLRLVRRVRTALRDGVAADPELAADLTGPLTRAAEATDPMPEAADFEITQFVPTGSAVPRTVRDAPPPGIPPRLPDDPGAAAVPVRTRRRRRRRRLAALLLALALTAATLTGWYLAEGRYTTTPALEMLSQAEAQAVADASGLTVRFDRDFSETVPTGVVARTDPEPGSRVRDGGEVVAYLSRGPERYPMPTVTGLSVQAAQEVLGRNQLVIGQTKTAYSDTVAKGMVADASHDPGTPLKPQTAVDLVISDGPKPIKIIDYSGRDTDAAVAALKKAGFAVTVKTENSDTVPKGEVINQTPSSGTGVRGDEISLVSSLGPVLVTVPNVRAMGTRAAQQVMKEAGFTTRVKPVATNYLGVGFVVYTDPRARSQAPKGSTITLFVV